MEKEVIHRIDSNNTKAKEILKSLLILMDEENETVYFPALVEAALDLLEKNSTVFSQNV